MTLAGEQRSRDPTNRSQEYESLAQDATEALGRLIALLGDVVSDEEAEEADEARRDNKAAAALAAVKEE